MFNFSFTELAIIFWIMMIILDGIIAFLVPAKRVESRLLDKHTRDKIVKNYVLGKKGIYRSIEPKVKKLGKDMINQLSTTLDNKIQNHITINTENIKQEIDHTLKNDVPHMLDDRITTLNDDIHSQITAIKEDTDEQLDDLKEDINDLINNQLSPALRDLGLQVATLKGECARAFSSSGVNARSEKKQEREKKEQILMLSPKHNKTYLFWKFLLGNKSITITEYDKGLDFMLGGFSGLFGSENTGDLPILPRSLPLQQASFEEMRTASQTGNGQTQESAKSYSVMDLSESEEIQAKNECYRALTQQLGFEPSVAKGIIKEGEKAQKIKKDSMYYIKPETETEPKTKKKKEKDLNGEKQETEKEKET